MSAPGGSKFVSDGKTGTRVTALPSEESTATTVEAEVVLGTSGPEVKSNTLESEYRISRWLWPTNGPIIQHFTGKNGNNGVDISGHKGAPIRAAAA